MMKGGPDFFKIRKARDDEAEAISIMEEALFFDAWSLNQVKGHFAQSVNLAYVAEPALKAKGSSYEKSRILGYLLGVLADGEAEIYRVAVANTARRHGIGESLIRELLKDCRKDGAKGCVLEVRSQNRAAAELYKKAGFKEAGFRKGYYKEPSDDGIIMRLEL